MRFTTEKWIQAFPNDGAVDIEEVGRARYFAECVIVTIQHCLITIRGAGAWIRSTSPMLAFGAEGIPVAANHRSRALRLKVTVWWVNSDSG